MREAGRKRMRSLVFALAMVWPLLIAVPAYALFSQGSPEQLLAEAKVAQTQGDFVGAARKYTEAAQLRPSGEVYEKVGFAWFLANSFSQAINALSEALRRDPERWASHLFLAESLYKLNRFQEALPHVKTALRLRPDENESRYWLGCIDHALGNYREAIAYLTGASDHDPQNVDILYSLTETYLDYSTVLLNRLDSETPSAQKRSEIDRQISEIASGAENMQSWNNSVGQLQNIANRYEKTFRSASADDVAIFTLCRVYGHLGDLTAERVWKLQPNSYRAHELRGESYEDKKNYDAALIEYREARHMNPSAPGVNYAMGRVYWEKKQLSQAIPELSRELALNPYHPSANYVLGHIYLRVDPQHPERAALYLQRAVEAKPDFLEARKQWGRALSLMHENEKAVEQLELAAKQAPRDDTVHYLLAGIYKSMGLEAKARKEVQVFDQLRTRKYAGKSQPEVGNPY